MRSMISLALLLTCPIHGQDLYVEVFVATKASGKGFPTLFANKDWASGKIKDYTTNHALGRSRTSGKLRGYAFALQPSGAWTFNLGDGKSRLDYRPTAPRQRVDDGELHMLAMAFDASRSECRLYFDGQNVAIYATNGLRGPFGSTDTGHKHADVVASTQRETLPTDAAIAEAFTRRTGRAVPDTLAPRRIERLTVLAWNIWHGGRRDGNTLGLQKTIDVIRRTGADVICMQETYGSGAAIADALGFHLCLRSTNLSVMSRYPIRESYDVYQPFRLGGARIELSRGQFVKCFSLWINHLPSIGKQMAAPGTTPASLVAADDKTRGREIRGILAALAAHTRAADETPVVVAGDFNSPSHLDWSAKTKARHKGLVVRWPVSAAMVEHGYTDAFRAMHPDPSEVLGRTWSPRFTDSYQMRIDYVYFRGRALRPTAARMLDQHEQGWPSDHAAVRVVFELGKKK